MADNQVINSSATSLVNSPHEWDMIETTCCNEQKCFIYDGKRIKWLYTFEMWRIFVEPAIAQSGKWRIQEASRVDL